MNLESLSRQKDFAGENADENIPDSSNSQYQDKPKTESQAKQYSNGLERTFSFEDYDAIINHAELLRQVSEKKTSEKKWLEELAEPLRADRVSESRVYEFANEMGIPKEYVERAIQNRFPSDEEMQKEIENAGKLDFKNVCRIYKEKILKTLEAKFPLEKFSATSPDHYDLNFFRIEKKIIKKRFFWKKYYKEKINKEYLAGIYLGGSPNWGKIHLYSPIFLHACSDILDKLNKKFMDGLKWEVNYHYNFDFNIE